MIGIESREKHENKNLSVLEDKLQMLKPNDREYAMSTCLIFIEGLEARKEVVRNEESRKKEKATDHTADKVCCDAIF